MKRIIYLSILLMLAATAVFADIARPSPSKEPKSKKPIDATLSIKLDKDAKDARLLIPRSQIKQLRAELEQLDDDTDNTAAATNNFSRTQTIVSGMLLSLALVFGGVWFVRSGKTATKSGKALVGLTLVLGMASAATYVYANAGPPSAARSITGRMFSESVHRYGFGWGNVKLETTNDDQLTLIVPNP